MSSETASQADLLPTAALRSSLMYGLLKGF
jgi:hypothetical protein